MTADERAWEAAVRPAAVLRSVERRLVAAGAVTELRQLHGLSAQEEAVLVWLELHEPLVEETASCAPGSPHAPTEMVAA